MPKCIVVDDSHFDWGKSQKPRLNWDEEVIYGSAPTLNIKFDNNTIIPLHAIQTNATTVVYQYTITLADAGYLVIDSLTGGLVKDSLDHVASYEFTQTGNRIFAENAVINETTNIIYANVQNAGCLSPKIEG